MLSINIFKFGIAATLATTVLFLSIIFTAKFGYTSTFIVMPIACLVGVFVLIGVFMAMNEMQPSKNLIAKILYSLGGILLIIASVVWLYIFVF